MMAAADLRRSRRVPFYGWVMVAGYFLSGVAGSGPTLWAFSVFVVPMQEDLGWSRSTFYLALAVRTVLTGVLTLFVSRLADKKGWPAPVVTVSSVVLAVSVGLLAVVETPVVYLLVFGGLGAIGTAGAAGTIHQSIVPKWFVRGRGRAVAVGSMGTAVAALVYPLFANWAIGAFGWRTAWVVMAVSALVALTPISVFLRRAPEDMGLLPDGETPEEAVQRRMRSPSTSQDEHSFRVGEVIRHRTTWFIVAATTLAAPTMVGLTSNWVPHYRDLGIGPTAAATALTAYGAASLTSRFVWGVFLDRYHVRWLAVAQALLTILTIIFLLVVVKDARTAIVYGAIQGLVLGGYLPIQPLIWANFFGRRHLGAIRGAFSPFTTASSALGPFAIATVHDVRGDYRLAFVVLAGFWVLVALFMAMARPINRPVDVRAGTG